MNYYVIYCPEMSEKFRNPIIVWAKPRIDDWESYLRAPSLFSQPFIEQNIKPSYIAIWKCGRSKEAEQLRKQLVEVVRNGRN